MARTLNIVFAGLLFGAGCTGVIGEGPPGGVSSELTCDVPTLGASPLRRLTRWEYNNTVRDILGVTGNPASIFAPEAVQFGFDNNADGATFNAVVIEDYERVARSIAEGAVTDLDGLLACDVEANGEDTCATQFLTDKGRRLFRRPLTSAEHDRYFAFYQNAKSSYGFTDAVRLLLSAMLQSPHFLYRIELGTEEPAAANAVRLTPFETATRLSYLLWGSAPDTTLLDAAAAGELETIEQVRAHAERMIDGERGATVVKNFYAQWAHLGELSHLQKEGDAFTPAIAGLMQDEAQAFVEYVLREGDGTMASLLTEPVSFLNEELAAFYGVEGVTGTAMTKVDLDPARASGMMTQGAMMARLAHPELKSAVNRGHFVLEKLLCNAPPPPPNNIDATLPGFDPEATSRDQLEQKTGVGICKSCHAIMNPVGFAFGHYDELGRWEDDEHGLEIDTSASIIDTDVAGEYEGHRDMLKAIAQSPTMHECLTVDWFRYAFGRDKMDEDRCTVEPAIEEFMNSGGNIRSLLVALTSSPAFLYRTRLDVEGGQ